MMAVQLQLGLMMQLAALGVMVHQKTAVIKQVTYRIEQSQGGTMMV